MDREIPNPLSSSGFRGSRAFVGRIRGSSFRIQVRHKNRNGLAPQLYGRVETADSGGSTVTYSIHMHNFTRFGLGLVLVVTLVFGTLLSVRTTAGPGQLPAPLWMAGMLFAWVVLVLVGRIGRRSDEDDLARLLAHSARVTPTET